MTRLAVGLLLLAAALLFLAWNEDRAAETARILAEGRNAAVSVASDHVDPANEGRLVHVSGEMRTEDTIGDPQFGISRNAIKLIREVEMYQWRESAAERGAETRADEAASARTDGYEQVWDSWIVDSSRFSEPTGHVNPPEKRFRGERYDDRTVTADNVTLGAFRLSRKQVDGLGRGMPLPLGSSIMKGLPKTVRMHARAAGNHIYLGGDPGAPEVGDLRVTFRILEAGPATVIAKQVGDGLAPYRTGDGRTIELVALGERSVQAMFDSATGDDALWTWGLRVVGGLAMALGLALVLKSLATAVAGSQVIGKLLGALRRDRTVGDPSSATPASDADVQEEPELDRQHEKLLMRAMITAARAAKCQDEETKNRIALQAYKAGLTKRERMVLREEMAKPWPMDRLAAACADTREKLKLYAVSLLTVPPENPVGNAYLHQLAQRLELTPQHLATVHERLGREQPAGREGGARRTTR